MAECGAEGKRLIQEELSWSEISKRIEQIHKDVIANYLRLSVQ